MSEPAVDNHWLEKLEKDLSNLVVGHGNNFTLIRRDASNVCYNHRSNRCMVGSHISEYRETSNNPQRNGGGGCANSG